ncbi:MAG: hypothetical protein JWP29_1585, partial [Rhodoferax sp.]|nr:hypothetical protein [Rhodoferax sp.]
MHIGEPTSQSKVARAARIFAVASCTAAMLATLLAAAPTQAQTYQAPSSFVSGTAGAGGQTSFRFGTATDVTVTFSTAFTTTGGIYSYGVRTASSTIGAIGNNSNAYLTGATTASLGSLLDLWGYGCAIPGFAPETDPNTGQLCVNRGTLTVTFSQPVVNPIIHLGGLGSSEVIASPGLHYAAEYTVASAANGASPVAATLSALSGSAAFAVTGGNKVQNSGPASSVSATCAAAAPGAACGSTRVNGTVTSVTFDVGLRGYGTQSQGTSTPTGYFQNQGSGYTDGHTVSASIAPQADLRVSKTDN